MASTFLTFIRHTRPRDWTRELLETLTFNQVELLCKLMGIFHIGTKQNLITRLLDLGALREMLSEYDWPDGDHAAEVRAVERLASAYKGDRLRALCRRAHIYAPGNKYGMAASLLSWRNQCRSSGQKVMAQLDAELAAMPARQRTLDLDVAALPVTAPWAGNGLRALSELPANNGLPKAAIFAGAVQLELFEDNVE